MGHSEDLVDMIYDLVRALRTI